MAYLIDRLKTSLGEQGYQPRTQLARNWLKNKIQELSPSRQSIMKDRERLKATTFIGNMYFFFYDAKTKDKLPYWDRFPLVIPIERYNDGFLGMNLHYIHPKSRLILLDKLSEYATNEKYDNKTRLNLSYNLLSKASKTFEATPCIKRYLFSHIESRFLQIMADEWDIAVLLPFENFQGATKSKVWSDSRKNF